MGLISLRAVPVVIAVVGIGCDKAPPKSSPAQVQHPVTESQLTTVKLTAEAIMRLGLKTVNAEATVVAATLETGGEVVVPSGQSITITAPVAATVLAPEGGSIPVAGSPVAQREPIMRLVPLPSDRDQMSAGARLKQAEAEGERVAKLYADRLVSAREHEQAQADLTSARATYRAATASASVGEADVEGMVPLLITAPEAGVIRVLNVAPGQAVAAGAALAEVVRMDRLWIRVPMFPGQAREVRTQAPVAVRSLAAESGGPVLNATPIAGPPTANAAAASIDFFYELRNPGRTLRPGERVAVTLSLMGSGEQALVVPLASVLYDMHGGTWIYVRSDSLTFVRTRVDIARVVGDRAVIARGVAAGAAVVTDGAVELFGTEFGVGK